MDTPGNTDMLSSISKAYWDLVDCDGGDSFLIINKKFMARSSKSHEFGLLGGKSNMVGTTVVKSKLEKIVEKVDIIREEDHVVSLSN